MDPHHPVKQERTDDFVRGMQTVLDMHSMDVPNSKTVSSCVSCNSHVIYIDIEEPIGHVANDSDTGTTLCVSCTARSDANVICIDSDEEHVDVSVSPKHVGNKSNDVTSTGGSCSDYIDSEDEPVTVTGVTISPKSVINSETVTSTGIGNISYSASSHVISDYVDSEEEHSVSSESFGNNNDTVTSSGQTNVIWKGKPCGPNLPKSIRDIVTSTGVSCSTTNSFNSNSVVVQQEPLDGQPDTTYSTYISATSVNATYVGPTSVSVINNNSCSTYVSASSVNATSVGPTSVGIINHNNNNHSTYASATSVNATSVGPTSVGIINHNNNNNRSTYVSATPVNATPVSPTSVSIINNNNHNHNHNKEPTEHDVAPTFANAISTAVTSSTPQKKTSTRADDVGSTVLLADDARLTPLSQCLSAGIHPDALVAEHADCLLREKRGGIRNVEPDKVAGLTMWERKVLRDLGLVDRATVSVAHDGDGTPLHLDKRFRLVQGLAFYHVDTLIRESLRNKLSAELTVSAVMKGSFGPVAYKCDYCSFSTKDDLRPHLLKRQHASGSSVLQRRAPGARGRSKEKPCCIIVPGLIKAWVPFRRLVPVCPLCHAIFDQIMDCVAHTYQHGGITGVYQLQEVSHTKTFTIKANVVDCSVCQAEFPTVASLLDHWEVTGHVKLKGENQEVSFFCCQSGPDCRFRARQFPHVYQHFLCQHDMEERGYVKGVYLGTPTSVQQLMPLFPMNSVKVDHKATTPNRDIKADPKLKAEVKKGSCATFGEKTSLLGDRSLQSEKNVHKKGSLSVNVTSQGQKADGGKSSCISGDLSVQAKKSSTGKLRTRRRRKRRSTGKLSAHLDDIPFPAQEQRASSSTSTCNAKRSLIPQRASSSTPTCNAKRPLIQQTDSSSTPTCNAKRPSIPQTDISTTPTCNAKRPVIPQTDISSTPTCNAKRPLIQQTDISSTPTCNAKRPLIQQTDISSTPTCNAKRPLIQQTDISSTPTCNAKRPLIPQTDINSTPSCNSVRRFNFPSLQSQKTDHKKVSLSVNIASQEPKADNGTLSISGDLSVQEKKSSTGKLSAHLDDIPFPAQEQRASSNKPTFGEISSLLGDHSLQSQKTVHKKVSLSVNIASQEPKPDNGTPSISGDLSVQEKKSSTGKLSAHLDDIPFPAQEQRAGSNKPTFGEISSLLGDHSLQSQKTVQKKESLSVNSASQEPKADVGKQSYISGDLSVQAKKSSTGKLSAHLDDIPFPAQEQRASSSVPTCNAKRSLIPQTDISSTPTCNAKGPLIPQTDISTTPTCNAKGPLIPQTDISTTPSCKSVRKTNFPSRRNFLSEVNRWLSSEPSGSRAPGNLTDHTPKTTSTPAKAWQSNSNSSPGLPKVSDGITSKLVQLSTCGSSLGQLKEKIHELKPKHQASPSAVVEKHNRIDKGRETKDWTFTQGLAFLNASEFPLENGSSNPKQPLTFGTKHLSSLGRIAYKCDYCSSFSQRQTAIQDHLRDLKHPTGSIVLLFTKKKIKSRPSNKEPFHCILAPGCLQHAGSVFRSLVPVCPTCNAVFESIMACVAHSVTHGGLAGTYALRPVCCSATMGVLPGTTSSCDVCNLTLSDPQAASQHLKKAHSPRNKDHQSLTFYSCHVSSLCNFHSADEKLVQLHVLKQHVQHDDTDCLKGLKIKIVVLSLSSEPDPVRRLLPFFPVERLTVYPELHRRARETKRAKGSITVSEGDARDHAFGNWKEHDLPGILAHLGCHLLERFRSGGGSGGHSSRPSGSQEHQEQESRPSRSQEHQEQESRPSDSQEHQEQESPAISRNPSHSGERERPAKRQKRSHSPEWKRPTKYQKRSHSRERERFAKCQKRLHSGERERPAECQKRSHSPEWERRTKYPKHSHSGERERPAKCQKRSHSPEWERHAKYQKHSHSGERERTAKYHKRSHSPERERHTKYPKHSHSGERERPAKCQNRSYSGERELPAECQKERKSHSLKNRR